MTANERQKAEASVTVPLCIALTILAVFILGLVEAARYYGLKENAKDVTNLAVESLFAGYQPFLLKEYQMFFLDGGFGLDRLNPEAAEDEMEMLLYENLIAAKEKDGMSLYHMSTADAEVTEYRLATDDNGKVFEAHAANVMKREIGKRAAKEILEKIRGIQDKDSLDPEEAIKNADQTLQEWKAQTEKEGDAAKAQTEEVKEQKETTAPSQEVLENPMDTIKTVRKNGVLALVLPPEKTVSAKTVSVDQCLMKRKLQKGNFHPQTDVSWYDRILMQEFIKQFAGNALHPSENGALSYGVEYVVAGKDSDEKNLKKIVNILLLLRESINFLYLQTDGAKKAEALAAATAIAGASANPLVITAVKQGILAAWAYIESICDVKALLSGGKIPLVKNAGNWQTQLSNLAGGAGMDYKGESSGLSYETYLDVFLYAKTVKQAAYRTMDLMEWNTRNEDGYENCRMDRMVTGMKITGEYNADAVFSGIFGKEYDFNFHFWERAEYVYQ